MSSYKQNGIMPPDRVPSSGGLTPNPAGVAPIANGKRPRRMRSQQGAAHYGNGQKGKKGTGAANKGAGQVEYHDRKHAAPIFLQKTYEMINACESHLASWTSCGTMFVIKEQKEFAQKIIPKFFDHSKFSSFARQLNFYGFRKMQSRAIYKNEATKENANHVTFFNEKFQRGQPHLLKEITRSTKGTQNTQHQQELQKETMALKKKVIELENTIARMQNNFDGRFAALETQIQQLCSYSNAQQPTPYAQPQPSGHVDYNNPHYNIHSIKMQPDEEVAIKREEQNNQSRATLSPHPDSKVLPSNRTMPPPPPLRPTSLQHMDSSTFMRGFSTYSISDELGDDLGMTPFEKKLYENTMNAPDPPTEPIPISAYERPTMTRDISQGFDKLDLNEFPPLTNV